MRTLRSYQQQAVDEIIRKNLLLADDTGLGKTITAIEAIKQTRGPILIVVPKTIKLQWYNAMIDQELAADCIQWLDTQSTLQTDEDMIVLTHYEALVKQIDHLKPFYWSLVVLDEAHRIKNRKAQRTHAVKAIKADCKLALTATPGDKPDEIWSILNWIAPHFFRSYWKFFDAHCNYCEFRANGATIKQINKAQPIKDVESYARVIRPYMLRRLKKDVRADLPDRIDQYVDLAMNPDQAKVYKKLFDAEINALLADGVEVTMPIVLTRILRLIQATTDPALLGLPVASSVKLDWLTEWLEDHPNESVIVFTRFRETAEKIASLGSFDKLIIGGRKRDAVTTADRRIVGTIAAMGEGLDLPWIDYAIFLDVEWSSILMQQAIDRIYRININTVKHVYYLRCANTVDQLVHDAVARKLSTKEIVEQFLIESRSS